MKLFFGFLFLILGGFLTLFQVLSFISPYSLSGGRLFLMLLLTIGCVIGASLVYADHERSVAKKVAGSCGFFVCLALMIVMAVQSLAGSGGTTGWGYFVMIVYTIAFGIYGFNGIVKT